ncbi:MAG: TIR domain-containing protein [archaeon]|nr:TIR domain-containing protein [archaeon]
MKDTKIAIISFFILIIGNSFLFIFFNSIPIQPEPTEIGVYSVDRADAVFISEGIAYIGEWNSPVDNNLISVNISDPANPTKIGNCSISLQPSQVFVSLDFAYITGLSGRVICVNVSDPANPQEVGYITSSISANYVYVEGQIAYIADGVNGLKCINISDPTNPTEIGSNDEGSNAESVFISDNIAYIAYNTRGLVCMNIADPTNPIMISSLRISEETTTRSAHNVFVKDNMAYLCFNSIGLVCIDVSDPSLPREIGRSPKLTDLSNFDWLNDIYVSDKIAYLTYDDGTLYCYDVSIPMNIRLIYTFSDLTMPNNVVVFGDVAYVADRTSGLKCIQVKDSFSAFLMAVKSSVVNIVFYIIQIILFSCFMGFIVVKKWKSVEPEKRINLKGLLIKKTEKNEQLMEKRKNVEQLEQEILNKLDQKKEIRQGRQESQEKQKTSMSIPFKAYNGEKPFLFVSYSHEDKSDVYQVIEYLKNNRVLIWYDEGIPASQKWLKTIAEKINECNGFLIFISSNSVRSENVLDEIGYALERYKKGEIQFIPIYLEDTWVPDDLKLAIGRIQALMKHKMNKEIFNKKLIEQTTGFVDIDLPLIEGDNGLKPTTEKISYKTDSIFESERPAFSKDLRILRGGNWMIEGDQSTFYYKVKVKNNSKFVVTDIQILLTSIPGGLNVESDRYKIASLKPGSFESPAFKLFATESCVGDTIECLVTYINPTGKSQTVQIKPFEITYVCNLLVPKDVSREIFDEKVGLMEKGELVILSDQNISKLESKIEDVIRRGNFALLEQIQENKNLDFMKFEGFAEGLYDKQDVALSIAVEKIDDGSKLVIEAMSDRSEKITDILRDFSSKLDDIKSDTELLKEYSSRIEREFERFENIDDLESFLITNLGSGFGKLKFAWKDYKEGNIKGREFIKQGIKTAGKNFIKIFIYTL